MATSRPVPPGQVAADRQPEVFITRGAPASLARAIQRRASQGELVPIAEGIYLAEKDPQAQAMVVRKNWMRIMAALVPDAVVSHRSAMAGGMTNNARLILSDPTRYNKIFRLPGLTVQVVEGPKAQPGDSRLGSERLYLASRPRHLLENLSRSRGPSGRAAGAQEVEKFLVSVLNASGEAEINRIRDAARALAAPMGMDKEFAQLDGLIVSLLNTRNTHTLRTKEGRFVVQGTPIDQERMARFEILASRLRAIPVPRQAAVATTEPAKSHFAFLESYFSNYVEGTEFDIEEAREITLSGRINEHRPKDSHDVKSVFRLAHGSPWRDAVPSLGPEFPEELAKRHAIMMERREEARPGQFKEKPNRAGNTRFVVPAMVRGTLIEGAQLALSVPEGLARAIYLAFLVSEVHPFDDGNGRLARLVMNAELTRTGEARIIIPTLLHEEYVDCQRQLSRQDDPDGHIRVLSLAQAWTIAFDFHDADKLIDTVRKTNALERSRKDFKLTMADASALGLRPALGRAAPKTQP